MKPASVWVFAGIVTIAALPTAATYAKEVAEITQAEFVFALTAAAAEPGQTTQPPSETVTLPDSWPRRGAPRQGYGWYRLAVPEAGASDAARWVYIPRFVTNANVYLNNVLIWSSGEMSPRPSHNWSRSALFPLPERLVDHGPKSMRIALGVDGSESGALSTVYVGDLEPLYRWSRQRDLLQRDGVFVTSGIILATSLYLVLLWTRVKQEKGYLFLGLGGLVWALRNAESLLVDVHMPASLVSVLDLLAISGHGVFFGLFGLFMLELVKSDVVRHARELSAAIWLCIVGSTASVMASPWLSYSAYTLLSGWLLLCFPLVAYLIVRLIGGAARRRDAVRGAVAALAATFFIASVYDNLVATHHLPVHWIYVAHYAGLLFFVCCERRSGTALIRR